MNPSFDFRDRLVISLGNFLHEDRTLRECFLKLADFIGMGLLLDITYLTHKQVWEQDYVSGAGESRKPFQSRIYPPRNEGDNDAWLKAQISYRENVCSTSSAISMPEAR